MSETIQEIEWDVYYQQEWVGSVFAIDDAGAARREAKIQFEHEDWDWTSVSVYRVKDAPNAA